MSEAREVLIGTPKDERRTDLRILPDLNQTAKAIDGRANIYEAEDWINSVKELANINLWPFNLRMQFVLSNLAGAARSWFLDRNYEDQTEFKKNLNLHSFVNCV